MSATPVVYVLSFLFALAVLIAVHEFGHFWVARKLGVKVLRFSIGFGNAIWSRRSKDGETEYVIAAIPLGGYVKMLDEREGEVKDEERDRAFNNKPVTSRMAIVLAGPLFNFIFAILILWVMFMGGVPAIKPVLGEVTPNSSAAQAGFQEGEQIIRAADRQVVSWQSFRMILLDTAIDKEHMEIEVLGDNGSHHIRSLYLTDVDDVSDAQNLFKVLGLSLWQAPSIMGEISAGGAAARAGLQAGDRVLKVNDEPVKSWSTWVDVVRARPGQELQLDVGRGEREIKLVLTPDARMDDTRGEEIGFVGVRFPESLLQKMRITVQYGPVESLLKGAQKTWDMSVLMLRMLGQMVIGEASLKNISGPITIAQYAGESASMGFTQFLTFLSVVSISLGVLNLLPVPILDGGHFLYYLVEMIQGRPLSEQAQEMGQRAGVVLILALMTLAFYNDFMRLLG